MRTNTARTKSKRTGTHPLWLVILALLAGTLGSVAAVAATTDTADACSIAGPYVEVWPSTNLQPGQQIEVAGWGFFDIRLHEPATPPAPTPTDGPADPAIAVPPELCDFDLVPASNQDVYWTSSNSVSWLGSVSGPDFTLVSAVPLDAAPGVAQITVGSVEVEVTVGDLPAPPPPPPCPLAATRAQLADDTRLSCPEPWPCPLHGADSIQPAPGADYAPGFLPPCPEPCVDYAHTIDNGTVYDYQWECPDPCSQTQVSPGAGEAAVAVWCPPPAPCGGEPLGVPCPPGCELVGGDAWVCPPAPEPCPVYFAAGGAANERGDEMALISCPDPCGDADQVWCPLPSQCGAEPFGVPCPPGCELVGGDADQVWCPPPSQCGGEPFGVPCPPGCELVGGDAWACPEATPSTETTTSSEVPSASPASVESTDAAPVAVVAPDVDTVLVARQEAAAVASNILEVVTRRILDATFGLRLALFS